MKVALVHDYLKEYGGAERVLEAFHEIWPKAPLYTTVYLPEFLGPHRRRFATWDIRVSWLQKIPYIEKVISPIRFFTPWVFENIDLSDFDVVIVSATGAYFPNLIVRKPKTLHICYCHTPPRYLYGYPTARDWQRYLLGRMAAGLLNHYLRQIDFLSYQRPDYLIANSLEVKKRIEKFYRREAVVIPPPVEIKLKLKNQKSKKEIKRKKYFLAGGRLARAKRIDLAIAACNELRLPLKIFGKGFAGYDRELKKLAGPTVEFLGEISDEELAKLYQGAKALIYPSEAEDFGIMPVEAQSFGLPVIALNQGGIKETVFDGKTGILFEEPTAESLIKAIKRLENQSIRPDECIKNAEKFSKKRFILAIKKFINSKLKSSINLC